MFATSSVIRTNPSIIHLVIVIIDLITSYIMLHFHLNLTMNTVTFAEVPFMEPMKLNEEGIGIDTCGCGYTTAEIDAGAHERRYRRARCRMRLAKVKLMVKNGYKYLKLFSIIATFIILGLLGNKEIEQKDNFELGEPVMETKIHSICSGIGRQISLNTVLPTDDYIYLCNVIEKYSSEFKIILTLYKGSRLLDEWNRYELDMFKNWLVTNGFYSFCYSHTTSCVLYMSNISFCLDDDGKLERITFMHHNISLDEISSSNFIITIKQFG